MIGAGFGRTGTYSLKLALETLGFGPCYHMFEVSQNPGHRELWEAMGADPASHDWEEIFAGYRSAVDWPASAFYAQLADRYSQAKVVLTLRDPQAWYESAKATIIPPQEDLDAGRSSPMVRRIVWDGIFGGRVHDHDHAIATLRRHVDEVTQRVPAARLLVYDAQDGWGPLCGFLGVPVPDEPYPHRNTTKEFHEREGA